MAPRRHRSVSNVQSQKIATPPPQRTLTPSASSAQRPLVMLPAVYQNNMKVILRREPSITSIVDQFSHVCLYRFTGEKWEKHGYEGSMFIFEKSTYPPYGFYILNRMGTEDYIRPIYPEDDMEITGDYLMCRFYPDFTQTRLDMGLPYPIPPESLEAFEAVLNRRLPPEESDKETDKKKEKKRGGSSTFGLWMFPTEAREPLKQVMMRLHSYVKQGVPYPEEYRYVPGRPPPQSRTSGTPTQPQDRANGSLAAPQDGIVASHSVPPPVTNDATAVDALFAKLLPSSTSAPVQTSAPVRTPASPPAPAAPKSVHDLLAMIQGPSTPTPQSSSSQLPLPIPKTEPVAVPTLSNEPAPTPAARSLLNMIFASAAQPSPTATVGPPQPLPAHPEEIVIVSPKPTSSTLPHVLTQDVISTLMGLAPDSRASSAAPSSAGSRRSAHRYEGDNEYSEGDFTSEGEFSKSSTVRNLSSAQRSIPTFSVPSSDSDREAKGKVNGSRRVSGDVTPRPPAGGARLPPTSPPQFQQRVGTPNANGQLNGDGNGNGHAPSPAPAPASGSAPRAQRPLVPFEANSDLWPYPRAPLDDRSFEQDDVVELDFTDTRALSDPAIYSSRLKDKKERKDKKKGRKERERDNERVKAEIDRSWDTPTHTQGQPAYSSSATGPVAGAATTKSITVPPAPLQSVEVAKQAVPVVNGMSQQNGGLNGTAARDALLSAMFASVRAPAPPQVEKNEFVRGLLDLIHKDPQFVDGLWQDYLRRTT